MNITPQKALSPTTWISTFVVLTILSISCSSKSRIDTSAEAEASSDSQSIAEFSGDSNSVKGLPFIGFNARGDVDTDTQVAFTDSMLSHLPQKVKSKLVIRFSGGTRSQKTFLEDWTDKRVRLWTNLQKKHGIGLIYVVNGNDTPANQSRVVQKFMDAGAKFDFLEMMNEYYLPKYRIGKTEKPEVKEKVDVRMYLDDILPRFWKELDRFGLPYYVIYAPIKPHASPRQNEYYGDWNEKMNSALNGKYRDRDLNAVIHMYKKDSGPYDYDQISRQRAAMPEGRHIAITEAGYLVRSLSSQENGTKTVEHYKAILEQLGSGDFLIDQVLYSKNKNDNTANLQPQYRSTNGLTPKGKLILNFIRNRYE